MTILGAFAARAVPRSDPVRGVYEVTCRRPFHAQVAHCGLAIGIGGLCSGPANLFFIRDVETGCGG